MGTLDVARARPMHTAADVARWARTSPQTARRWVTGYKYEAGGAERWSPPIGHPRGSELLLTFDQVIEVAAIAAIRRAGPSLQRIRADIDFARHELGIEHPLLSESFLTDGRDLFLRDAATRPNFTNLSRSGQVAWSNLEEVLREVDYADDLYASRWWPAGRDAGVVVDPLVNFGRPIVAIVGVRTDTLVDRWIAGVTIGDLAEEYQITARAVESAMQFENRVAIEA